MGTVHSILIRRFAGLDAEAKFVLSRWVRAWELAPVFRTQMEIAHGLELPDAIVTRAVPRLVKAGCLERESSRGKAHKVAVTYRVADDLMTRVNPMKIKVRGREEPVVKAREPGQEFLTALVHHMLSAPFALNRMPGVKRAPAKRTGAGSLLNPANRLVLMSLLACADGVGVVQDARPSDLAKLVGLSGTSFRGQLQKLVDLGYVRAVVPGVSGRELFGVRPGVIVLNLQHPAYGGLGVPAVHFLIPAKMATYVDRRSPLSSEFVSLARLSSEKGSSRDTFNRMRAAVETYTGPIPDMEIRTLAKRFAGPGSGTVRDYFAWVIEFYAARLLTEHWNEVATSRFHVTPTMAAEMRALLMPARATGERNEDVGQIELKMAGLACAMAIHLAIHIKDGALVKTAELGEFDGMDLRGMRFTIIPKVTSSNGAYLIVSAYANDQRQQVRRSYCIDVLLALRPEISQKPLVTFESDIRPEDAYRYGLLTRPERDRKTLPATDGM